MEINLKNYFKDPNACSTQDKLYQEHFSKKYAYLIDYTPKTDNENENDEVKLCQQFL